jgi:hypothetical protein
MSSKKLTTYRWWHILGVVLLTCLIFVGTSPQPQPDKWAPSTPVLKVLHAWGLEKPKHYLDNRDTTLAQKGKELLTEGRTTHPNGSKTPLQSNILNSPAAII